MIFREDKGTGYMYSHQAGHPCANRAGKVLEHVLVMTEALGRPLHSDECVHHLDGNKQNNIRENLQAMLQTEHGQLHALQRKYGKAVVLVDGKFFLKDTGEEAVKVADKACLRCGAAFPPPKSYSQYCSQTCANEMKKRFNPSKAELEALVWGQPTTKIAKFYGVSDSAVAKRCKRLGIVKPARGYWTARPESIAGLTIQP